MNKESLERDLVKINKPAVTFNQLRATTSTVSIFFINFFISLS